MESFEVELTDEERDRLECRGQRRGIDPPEEYLQTLVDQLLALMAEESKEVDADVEEDIESKLEALGYL